MAITIRLGSTDLTRVRFAISPLHETVSALRVLHRPGAHAISLPWARWAAPRWAADPDAAFLAHLLARHDTPIFMVVPPDTRLPDLDTELHRITQVAPDRVVDSMRAIFGAPADQPARIRRLYDDPPAGLAAIATALRRFHDLTIAPHWPRIQAVLDADIAHRTRRLGDSGLSALLNDLHPLVGWADPPAGPAIRVRLPAPATDVPATGAGLLLGPSVFVWPQVRTALRPLGIATLRYPARGTAALWQPTAPAPDGLATLLGRTRAALLSAVATPATTPQLAYQLGVTPSAVSQHLAVLRGAGLVTTERHGRTAIHLRTPRGDGLTQP